jgi:archaellum component FlaC
MSEIDEAVEEFLENADTAYDEYDQGYADADATLRRLKRHIEDLRETHEDA